MEVGRRCTCRSLAFIFLNQLVIALLVVFLLYVSGWNPTAMRLSPRKDVRVLPEKLSFSPKGVNSSVASIGDLPTVKGTSYVNMKAEGQDSPMIDTNISKTERIIKTANWITKDYILSQLAGYKAPKLDLEGEKSLQSQLGQYKPANFGANLNLKPPDSKKFLKDMKNPCWREGSTLHCLPYYYLLGFPKCGTTDLWHRISQHPLQAGTTKELHWWTRGRYGKPPLSTYAKRFTQELSKKTVSYNKSVKNVTNATRNFVRQIITGDGSPSYMWDVSFFARKVIPPQNTVTTPITEPELIIGHLIKAYTPQAKFIVIVRDPVDAVYSHYLFQSSGRSKSPANFHQRVTQIIAMYDDCFKRHTIRACVYDPNLLAEGDRQGVRLYHVLYVVFFSDWFKVFARNQFHIIRTEDYGKDIEGHMRDIFKFLDVAVPEPPIMNKIVNFKHANAQSKRPLWEETRQLLKRFVRPFNDAFADLLGDGRFAWK